MLALIDTYQALLRIAEEVEKQSTYPDPYCMSDDDNAQWYSLIDGVTRVASVRQLMRDFLTYWNEAVGADVEEFWRRVSDAGLPVERKTDTVVDTLKRGRVLHPGQFYDLKDRRDELQRCGKLDADQAARLDSILTDFAEKSEEFVYVRSRF